MDAQSHPRRTFIKTSAAAVAAMALPLPLRGADQSASQKPWPIGCHARPFGRFRLSHDDLLDAIKTAGYTSADMISAAPPAARGAAPAGGGTAPPAQRGPAAITPEMVTTLKEKLAARGMVSTVCSLSIRTDVALADAVAAARQQITNAHTLGQKFALYLGLERENQYIHATKVLADAAAFGKERGVQVAIKQHHGLNNTGGELVGWVKQVNHPNFGLFHDAGNVIYYTGKDPVAQLEIVGPYVIGVVAKDCLGPHFLEREAGAPGFGSSVPDPRGDEVMIQFGTGKVDFAGMFKKLKSYGFNGPVFVEGTAVGETVEQTIANARANREFLERARTT
ncbi:MAG TPA: TIM barrel protein [Vicinamibacterales bacterium]|nr:TIM barrel protein [Vicinamibacterales bacterium]